MALPFIPGYTPASPRLLERFLPPLPDGVAALYIQQHSRPGDLILDPFGSAPNVAVETLALGRRSLVASFNPIGRLVLSLAIRPAAISQLRSALTMLADAPIGPGPSDRLEMHVRGLYASTCAECQGPVTADAFEWDAEAGELISKSYVCPNCGGPRDSPVDEADRARARRFVRGGLDYYFLLDRVAEIGDPDRGHAEEALAVYPARTLHAIGSALNRLEALPIDREQRRLLAGLFVAAFDQSATLGQERPRALAVPRLYKEVNFWLALERAVSVIAGSPSPDQAVTFEQLMAHEAHSGIYAHAGPLRELATRLLAGAVSLVISGLPRPNQAFWTLSVVWSAWLWGRDSANTLRAVLRRRRYDWAWHARALQRTLELLPRTLRLDGRLVTLVSEAEPGFVASVIAAANGSGFVLEQGALRADTTEAQAMWSVPPTATLGRQPATADGQRQAAQAAMVEMLRARAEPTRWGSLNFAAWSHLIRERLVAWDNDEPLARVQRAVDSASENKAVFERFGATRQSEATTGTWCLSAARGASHLPPLADRVEVEVRSQLAEGSALDEISLQGRVYAALPGYQTPGRALVIACLASYGEKNDGGQWRLRSEDVPDKREVETAEIARLLADLAARHGYVVDGVNPQTWLSSGRPASFVGVISSAAISQFVLAERPSAPARFIVMPGGRAGLIEYKLRRDARLRRACDADGWNIVKFRHVRHVAAQDGLSEPSPGSLEAALVGDPVEGTQQLALIE